MALSSLRFESHDGSKRPFFHFCADFIDFDGDRENPQWYVRNEHKKLERTIGMIKSNRERGRILVVEDHEDAREIAAFSLEEYTLVFACGFDEGLRLARRGYFDGTGVEMCRVIRGFDPHTPILFCSACAYGRDLEAAFSAGAQEYLVKPVIFDELKLAVAQLISAARETAFEARRAGVAAIQEELAIRQIRNAARVEKAKEKRLRSEEKALRLKAEMAYLAAGGTRGNFAREWLSVFSEEVRGARTSDASSAH
jgi:CheY-like chemotaxis protein